MQQSDLNLSVGSSSLFFVVIEGKYVVEHEFTYLFKSDPLQTWKRERSQAVLLKRDTHVI